MKDVLIFSLLYLLGAFVTKVIITFHDIRATLHYRVGDCDSEIMAMWIIALPLMLIVNVLADWQAKTKRDIFFPEEDEMIQIFRDYVNKEREDE